MRARGRAPDSPWMLVGLVVGSLVPCLLAVALITLTQNDEDPPGTATSAPAEEALRVPFGGADEVHTEQTYQGTVRLFFEGSSAEHDAFYHVDDEASASASELSADLEIDGQPALETLQLSADPPPYAPDHLYAVRYDVGPTPRRLAFRMGGPPTGAALTITVVPIR